MKKMFMCALSTLTTIFILTPTAVWADNSNIQVKVNNQPLQFNQQPVIVDGTTLVPLRAIFEALGAKIVWDAQNKVVVADKGDISIRLTIDQNVAEVNRGADRKYVDLSVPTTIINGSTMVPTRFVAESLGAKVDWSNQTVTIDLPNGGQDLPSPSNAIPVSTTEESTEMGIYGVAIGDTADSVKAKLGTPDRIDKNDLGYDWWVYNHDLKNYVQVGIQNGVVTDIYSNASTWTFHGLKVGSSKAGLQSTFPFQSSIQLPYKSSEVTIQNDNDDYQVYMVNNVPILFYLDKYDDYKITSIRFISTDFLIKDDFFNRTYSEDISKPNLSTDEVNQVNLANEKEILDITNVYRIRNGHNALSWNDQANKIAEAHCEDMKDHNFFDHTSLTTGLDPFQRMEQAGIQYTTAGENIAEGQNDGIAAVEGWMNSEGHRKNILNGPFKTLGVGVKGKWYTQDFVTP